jgi:Domain of unknown function (DUF2804), C-terminal
MQSITPDTHVAAAGAYEPARRMALLRGGRPLKRWRYVGVFSDELMACAALVQVGPARQSFWALYRRGEDELYERTRMLPRRGELQLETGRLLLRDRGLLLDLALDEDAGFQTRCPNGRQSVWTRKQAGIAARGTLTVGGQPPRPVEARAVIDDTAGYHTRHTEWWWSAGVGESPEGEELAWNLVSGVNDPERGSERAVWIAGEPHEVEPTRFSADLRRIDSAGGAQLCFHAEAERARRENLLIFKSDYRAPFGTFSGSLPGGIALAHGLGVVEHHRAVW